jgi:putative RecB family exonuclease
MEKTASLLKEKPSKFDGLWLSVSKAKTFDDCPAKFRFCYIEQLPRKTWDFHVLGSFAHNVLERFQKARLDGETMPDHQLMTQSFNDATKKFQKDLTKDQKKLVYEMATKYLHILAEQRESGNEPRVINAESNFYVDIGGEILLNGMIDVEQIDPDDMLHLADYKTSKSTRYVKRDFFQLLTYAYVKCIEDPELEEVRCSYIMLRHGFKHFTKEFSRDEVMKVQDKLLEYAEKMNNEKLYRANPTRLCEYCDYVEHCPEGCALVGNRTAANYGAQSWG